MVKLAWNIHKPFLLREWKIFITCWLVYALFLDPIPQSMALNILDLATSMIDNFSLELDQHRGMDTALRDCHFYSGLPPGASIVAAVVYLLLKPLFLLIDKAHEILTLNMACTLLVAAPASALCAVLLYRFLLRLPIAPRKSLLCCFLFAFGTMHFGYASGFYKKTLVSCLLFGIFLLLHSLKSAPLRSKGTFFFVGFGLSFAIVLDYPSVLIVGVLSLYILSFERSRFLLYFALGGSVPMLFFVIYQKAAMGGFFTPSYHLIKSGSQLVLLGTPQPSRLLDLLFGPARGFFIYMPFMVLMFHGIFRSLFVDRTCRAEIVTSFSIFVITSLFFSSWWTVKVHEASLVSRYLLPTIPFCMIPVAFSINCLRQEVVYCLAFPSICFSYLGIQASMIPSHVESPVVYAAKVFLSSFGMGAFFSNFLPKALGFETFHSYISRADVTLTDILLYSQRHLVLELFAKQLLIFAVFIAVCASTAFVIFRLWSTGGPTEKRVTDETSSVESSR